MRINILVQRLTCVYCLVGQGNFLQYFHLRLFNIELGRSGVAWGYDQEMMHLEETWVMCTCT